LTPYYYYSNLSFEETRLERPVFIPAKRDLFIPGISPRDFFPPTARPWRRTGREDKGHAET
jgi:hypothetical protein